MVQCGLACVVSETALLRHNGICARCDHGTGRQVLKFQDSVGFVDGDVNSGDINCESPGPLVIGQMTRFVGRKKHACRNHNCVETAISEHGGMKHPSDGVTVRDVTRGVDRSSTPADVAARHAYSFSVPGDNLSS